MPRDAPRASCVVSATPPVPRTPTAPTRPSARSLNQRANNGSLVITGTFTITADDCAARGGCLTVGTTVNKVGRTTGWTAGAITNTCVNTGVQGTRFAQLCQTFVSAGVGGGDSGSDVFQIVNGGGIKLAGVLWGGNSGGSQFVFSPLGNVISELGPLVTH